MGAPPFSTQIFYGSGQIDSPTPIVGKQESFIRYGERWGVKSALTLQGQITGCTYTALLSGQKKLISLFSQDFQPLSIIEGGKTVYSKPYVIVRSIDFPASRYAYLLDYRIDLDCYDQNLFSGVYGVLDPVDEWKFDENAQGLINVSHSISARGFNTFSGASNALDNAKNFVLARTGLNPNIRPYFITTPSGFNPCLKALQERTDRFTATYGVTETYLADKYFGTDGVLRYTVDFDCNEEGTAKVGVHGTIDGCGMVSDVTSIRARYNTLDVYGIALDIYQSITNSTGLNSAFISRGFTEDPYARKLTFNEVYDNTSGTDVYLDYGINLESGENGITTVNFNGQIKGRGDLRVKWDRVQNYYQTFDPFPLSNDAYQEFAGGLFALNPKPLTKGVTFNAFQGEIGLNYTWDNKDLPWPGFDDLNYTLNYTLPIEKIVSIPLLNECNLDYYLADAGFSNRGTFSIDGRGRLACDLPRATALDLAYTSAKQHANEYFISTFSTLRPLLEVEDKNVGNYDLGFKFQWSSDGDVFTLGEGISGINASGGSGIGGGGGGSGANVPILSSLSPNSINAGGGNFSVLLNGSNFLSNSTARYNGANKTTTFIHSQSLSMALTSTDISTPGARSVDVDNGGGNISNALNFTVNSNPSLFPPVITYTYNYPDVSDAWGYATINPKQSATTYYWEYGGIHYGNIASGQIVIPANNGDTTVNGHFTGLNSGTLYHYRLVASNAGGITTGIDQTVTTSLYKGWVRVGSYVFRTDSLESDAGGYTNDFITFEDTRNGYQMGVFTHPSTKDYIIYLGNPNAPVASGICHYSQDFVGIFHTAYISAVSDTRTNHLFFQLQIDGVVFPSGSISGTGGAQFDKFHAGGKNHRTSSQISRRLYGFKIGTYTNGVDIFNGTINNQLTPPFDTISGAGFSIAGENNDRMSLITSTPAAYATKTINSV